MKLLAVSLLLMSCNAFAAFDLTKIADAEVTKCQSVLDLKSIEAYSLVAEWQNYSPEKLKAKLSPELLALFNQLFEKVKPYVKSLAEKGEVIDLTGKDAVAIQCADFAKAALLVGSVKLYPLNSASALEQ